MSSWNEVITDKWTDMDNGDFNYFHVSDKNGGFIVQRNPMGDAWELGSYDGKPLSCTKYSRIGVYYDKDVAIRTADSLML